MKVFKWSGSVEDFSKPVLCVRQPVGWRQPLPGFVTAAGSQKMWESFLAGDCGLLFLSVLAALAFCWEVMKAFYTLNYNPVSVPPL